MSDSFLFDTDPITRTVEIFHSDESAGKFWIESQQDVSAIIDQNKRDKNAATRYNLPVLGDKGLGRRVANVPMTLLGELWRLRRERDMSHDEWQTFLAKWLNNSDNRAFRTDGSRV